MAAYPLATFIVAADDQPYATPLPLVIDADRNYLLGHMDVHNPAAAYIRDGQPAMAIFHGPQGYISPHDYVGDYLPTYNYQQVHVQGRLKRLDANATRADLHLLIRAMEPADGFQLADTDPRIDVLLPHITGFHLHIESVVGRFKLSQDKSPENQARAARKLR
jgi:Transcriptional regulator